MNSVEREIDFESEWKTKFCPLIARNCLGTICTFWVTTTVEKGEESKNDKARGVCTAHK